MVTVLKIAKKECLNGKYILEIKSVIRALVDNWDREVFRDLQHEEFLFIRETELLTLDEHVENLDRLVREEDYLKKHNPTLVHEN